MTEKKYQQLKIIGNLLFNSAKYIWYLFTLILHIYFIYIAISIEDHLFLLMYIVLIIVTSISIYAYIKTIKDKN